MRRGCAVGGFCVKIWCIANTHHVAPHVPQPSAAASRNNWSRGKLGLCQCEQILNAARCWSARGRGEQLLALFRFAHTEYALTRHSHQCHMMWWSQGTPFVNFTRWQLHMMTSTKLCTIKRVWMNQIWTKKFVFVTKSLCDAVFFKYYVCMLGNITGIN